MMLFEFLRSHHIYQAWAISPLDPPFPSPYAGEDDFTQMKKWLRQRARIIPSRLRGVQA